jgi:hypothetical protein
MRQGDSIHWRRMGRVPAPEGVWHATEGESSRTISPPRVCDHQEPLRLWMAPFSFALKTSAQK